MIRWRLAKRHDLCLEYTMEYPVVPGEYTPNEPDAGSYTWNSR
jgi:hypothetical protein